MNAPATSNTSATSSTSIGLIIGVIVALVAIIAVVIFVIKRRRNAGGAAAVPTAANGMGVMNNGSNAVPNTTMNVNSGNGRPPQ